MKRHFDVPRARFIALPLALISFPYLAYADDATIVVSASRSAQLVTDALPDTTVIGRDVIENSPASDVLSLLKNQAGLSITQSGTQGSLSGIRIRGGEPRHTLVLLDGVPMSNLSAGLPALEQIALSSVERIEIVRGNVSALYGSQAVGGVVQIFTRKPSGNDALIRVAGGSSGQVQSSIQVRGGDERVQATVGISHEQVKAVSAQNPDDIQKINPYNTVNPDKDGYSNDSANAHIRYRPTDNHEFGLHFLESRGKNNYDNQWGASDLAHQYNRTKIQNLSLYANNQWTKRWKTHLRISQLSDKSDDYDLPASWGTGVSHYKTRTREISLQNNIFTKAGQFILGASQTQQKLFSDVQYNQSKRTTTSVWAGYNLDKGRHHVQVNARTDQLSDIGRENTASINYGVDLAPNLRLIGGYSNGFTAPTFNDLFYPGSTFGGVYYPVSNPNLKAEHATYAQAGLQYAPDNWGARINVFQTNYRDKIVFTTIPVNINRATARGVEWHGWYNAYGWNLESSLTYQQVKDRATGEQLIRQPKVLARFGVGKTWGKWQAQLDFQAQSGAKDIKKTHVAGYGVVNAAIHYSPIDTVKLGLSLGNLFNRQYQTIYGYNSMPRNVLLSLQYQPKW